MLMPRQHRHVPSLFRSEIKRAYARGDGTAETAKDFGVSKSYPSKLAKRDGLQMRRPRKQVTKHEKDEAQ